MQVSTETGAPAQADTAPATTALATDNGSGGVVDSGWITALPEDTRKTAEAKGWKSPVDAVKSYVDLQRAYTDATQSAIKPLSPDAPKEEFDAFAAKLGRPEKPDGYAFKLPEGIPETFPYDDTTATEFKVAAHEAGMLPRQAQLVHDWFVKKQASQVSAFEEQRAKESAEAHAALVKEWGDPATETFKRKQEMANRAIRHGGGDAVLAELKSLGALGPDGSVLRPHLAKLLSKLGEQVYAEDSLYGGQGSSGPNPFAPGDPENLTKQAEIIRSDPDRARALIRLSGQDPKTWGL